MVLTPFIAILSLTGCFLLPKEEQVLAPPLNVPAAVNYDVQVIKKRTIERKTVGTGYFVSVLQSDLFFKYKGGHLKSFNVVPGQKVGARDVVAELDTDTLESDIKKQELALKKARYTYDSLYEQQKDGRVPAEIQLARLQLEDYQRYYNKVDTALNNLKPGMDIKDIFKDADIDNIKSQLEQKKLAVVKAEDNFRQELRKAALDVDAEKLKLESLRYEYEKSKLVSPVAGEVSFIDNKVKPGDYVEAYSLLIRVADPTQMQLQYSDPIKVLDFKLGMKVEVKLDNKVYTGEVCMTPAEAPIDADESLKKSVRINIDKLPSNVQIGNSADISLLLEKKDDTIVIPRNTVKIFGTRKVVQVLEDDVKKEFDIETGIETPTEIEVVKGLKEGDKLIIR